MDNYTVIFEFPGDLRFSFSHLYFDPPGFSGIKERVFGSKGAIDLATATWSEREKRGAIKLDVPDAAAAARATFPPTIRWRPSSTTRAGRRTPLNNAESARISTLTAMMGRKSIYERRVVTWDEVDV